MPSAKDYRLDDREGFAEALQECACKFFFDREPLPGFSQALSLDQEFSAGQLYCPNCAGPRRMKVEVKFCNTQRPSAETLETLLRDLVPSLFLLHCLQCSAEFTAVIHRGPDRPALCILPSVRGGLSTSHSPEGVVFYLDQAQRAFSVGAHSAAIAMYRGALEHLLFEQGYQDGMLGTKLATLERHVASGTGPTWAKELDHAFLQVLKDLGNGAIHPNDGDTKRQRALDSELMRQVQDTVCLLLYLVYEVPHEKGLRLGNLQKAKAALLKK